MTTSYHHERVPIPEPPPHHPFPFARTTAESASFLAAIRDGEAVQFIVTEDEKATQKLKNRLSGAAYRVGMRARFYMPDNRTLVAWGVKPAKAQAQGDPA